LPLLWHYNLVFVKASDRVQFECALAADWRVREDGRGHARVAELGLEIRGVVEKRSLSVPLLVKFENWKLCVEGRGERSEGLLANLLLVLLWKGRERFVLVAVVDFVEEVGVFDTEHLILKESSVHLLVFLLLDARLLRWRTPFFT